METTKWDEEAIPERDPSYELPGDGGSYATTSMTMSYEDQLYWEQMVQIRPALKYLRS